MKDPENTSKSRLSQTLVPAPSGRGFPEWLVAQIREGHTDSRYLDAPPKSSHANLRLSDESKRNFINPPWSLVEYVVRTLDPGDINSHVCLMAPGATYVQCLCGLNGWHLEWRITEDDGTYVHYRACLHGGSKEPAILQKNDFVSEGEVRDIVQVEHVLEAFHSFHQNLGVPRLLDWRVLHL
jgi:hypothetical protein